MEVNKGEFLGIVGESGFGKTTLAAILQKHYFIESGTILINNEVPLEKIKTRSWRKKIGVVEQVPAIFNGSLVYNISMGRQFNPQKMDTFLRQHGFDTYFSQLPGGYLTPLGEEGINISGGQRQLVAFARALFNQPQLLILDEATSAMDKKTEAFVFELLKKLKKEMIVIFITHREYSLPENADKIYRFSS